MSVRPVSMSNDTLAEKLNFCVFLNIKGYFDCFYFIEHAGRGLRDKEAERVEHPDLPSLVRNPSVDRMETGQTDLRFWV